MRKKRRKSTSIASLQANPAGDEHTHFRLCHLCLYLNESNQEIVQCQSCARCLTIETMVEEKLKRARRMQNEDEEYGEESPADRLVGLNGLAVLW